MFNLNTLIATLAIAVVVVIALVLATRMLGRKKHYGMVAVLDDGTEQSRRRHYATLDQAQAAAQSEQRSLYADGQLGVRVMPTRDGSIEKAIKERGAATTGFEAVERTR